MQEVEPNKPENTQEVTTLNIEKMKQRILEIEHRELELVETIKDADTFSKELTKKIASLEHDTSEMTAMLRVKEREEEKMFRWIQEKERLFKEKEGLYEMLKLIETTESNDLERAARAFEGAGAFKENNRLAA